MTEHERVSLVRDDGCTYIRKRLLADIDMAMCLSKKHFVAYLIDCGIPAARLLSYQEQPEGIIEHQEYIAPVGPPPGQADCLRLAALLHRASRAYPGTLLQKRVLRDEVSIEGATLGRVLLGFREKYERYPRETFLRVCQIPVLRDRIAAMHAALYAAFCGEADTEACIIHNDLTPNNILPGPQPTLIDFDLAIRSSVYVDVADIVFPRTLSLYDFLPHMQAPSLADKVALYNRVSGGEPITVRGLKRMGALKLLVFVMYIYAQHHAITEELADYLEQVFREAMGT